MQRISISFVAWLFSLLAVAASAQDAVPTGNGTKLRSPNGRIVVAMQMPAADGQDVPRWSATCNGKALLADCKLSLVAEGAGDLLAGAQASPPVRRQHDERVAMHFGKADTARDHYEELRVPLQRLDAPPVTVVFRCFDDAIAFRYEVGPAAGHTALRLLGEGTTFALVGNPTVYAQYLEHHRTSHEHAITALALAGLPAGKLLDTPLTAVFADGPFVSITEAALRHYAGMSLRVDENVFTAALAGPADAVVVARPLPMVTPWRVVLVGDRPGVLLESNTLWCLNEPATADTTWIKPGKLTWPWWNGYLFEAERTDPILSLASARKYIDFCAANGIAFHAIVADESDTPWYHQSKKGLSPGPDTDATRARDDFDLASIKRYATEKGIGLWTWVHHAAMRGRVDEVFAALAHLGWNGVMVDFLDSDDQATVEFAEEVLTAAGKHHVLVHFHGMYKPTGWQRTFPHLMNHEGSLNLEYLKWSDRCTPEHDLLVAFTRLVAGPMDYHLGGFRAVDRATFQPHHVAPNVLGTRGHQLAMYVCFDNPSPMVADYPAAYRNQPGFEFVQQVPTWWDETRVLDAEIGRLLVTARRRGSEWWIGGLAAGEARELAVPLSFLPVGRHALSIWRDGDTVGTGPDALAIERSEVGASDVLRLRIAAGGGFVMHLTPRE
ncbi:MAG: glycoside hydrolase family 97 protein [Planctomycetota bacterium]